MRNITKKTLAVFLSFMIILSEFLFLPVETEAAKKNMTNIGLNFGMKPNHEYQFRAGFFGHSDFAFYSFMVTNYKKSTNKKKKKTTVKFNVTCTTTLPNLTADAVTNIYNTVGGSGDYVPMPFILVLDSKTGRNLISYANPYQVKVSTNRSVLGSQITLTGLNGCALLYYPAVTMKVVMTYPSSYKRAVIGVGTFGDALTPAVYGQAKGFIGNTAVAYWDSVAYSVSKNSTVWKKVG
jgi:hypothetical protein